MEYELSTDLRPLALVAKKDTFIGFRRKNGRIGKHNYIVVVTSVKCSATVAMARMIADQFTLKRSGRVPQ